jgi:hypothetical protein
MDDLPRYSDRRRFFRSSTVGLTAGLMAGAVNAQATSSTTDGPAARADGQVYNVKHFDAKGDGAADDTAAIQAAITAASQAAGGGGYLPPGSYRTTKTLDCRGHNVAISGAGGSSILRPVGNFDTLRFALPGVELYRNRVADLAFGEEEKTGGRTIVGENVAQLMVERVWGVAGWSGWHFHNFNCATLNDCRFESYRGEFYGRATGGGKEKAAGRSDVLRLMGLVHGGSRKEGMIGLDIDGFVHTVSGAGVYLVAIGGRALWSRNSIGAESYPSFFTFDDLETDYPDGEAIRLEGGEHYYFNNTMVHATRSAASNIYIGPEAKGVSFTGGFSTGSHQAGIHIEGQNVSLSAMHFHANSSEEFGGKHGAFPGILIGKNARDVMVTGCRAGRETERDWQSYGCLVEQRADGLVITGNDFRHNAQGGIKNEAGEGPAKVIANNI